MLFVHFVFFQLFVSSYFTFGFNWTFLTEFTPSVSSFYLKCCSLISKFRSNHLELTIVELHADYDKTLTQFMVDFERKLTSMKNGSNDNLLDSEFVNSSHNGLKSSPEESPFPILFLSYSDLIEASDAMQYIAARRFDAVFIFAPHFIIGESTSCYCCFH